MRKNSKERKVGQIIALNSLRNYFDHSHQANRYRCSICIIIMSHFSFPPSTSTRELAHLFSCPGMMLVLSAKGEYLSPATSHLNNFSN